MPVVIVYGVPKNVSSLKLNLLRPEIKRAVAAIPELCCKESVVDVYFNQEDFDKRGFEVSQGNISVLIFLYAKAERTRNVLQEVNKAVVLKIKESEFGKNELVSADTMLLDPKTSYSA